MIQLGRKVVGEHYKPFKRLSSNEVATPQQQQALLSVTPSSNQTLSKPTVTSSPARPLPMLADTVITSPTPAKRMNVPSPSTSSKLEAREQKKVTTEEIDQEDRKSSSFEETSRMVVENSSDLEGMNQKVVEISIDPSSLKDMSQKVVDENSKLICTSNDVRTVEESPADDTSADVTSPWKKTRRASDGDVPTIHKTTTNHEKVIEPGPLGDHNVSQVLHLELITSLPQMAPAQSEDEGGPHDEKWKRRETKKLREMTRVVALQMDNFKRKLQLHQSKKKVQGRLTQSVQRLRTRRKHLQRHGRAEHISTQEVMKVSSLSAARSSDEFVSMVTPRRRRSATSLFKRAFTKTPNLAQTTLNRSGMNFL